jgi:hypothetical protein
VAPVLLCPECGAKHPLENVGSRSAFPCTGCGRTLKVPAVAQVTSADLPLPSVPPPPVDDLPWPVASSLTAPPSALDPHATQTIASAVPPLSRPVGEPVPPPVGPPGGPAPQPAAGISADDLIPPRGIRFLMWFIAVPLAFVIVFTLARSVGLLTTNEVTDVALAEGWSRFWPIARLLPFVALATAGILQGAVYGIARLRLKRSAPSSEDTGEVPRLRSRARSRSRQSSRTDA